MTDISLTVVTRCLSYCQLCRQITPGGGRYLRNVSEGMRDEDKPRGTEEGRECKPRNVTGITRILGEGLR
jgi:hypothetical protein